MQEPSFDKLAADAAAGLRADREVYLEISGELRTFLDDKAERFRQEGHNEEESVELAKKAFGSPLEVAAELLNANRRRLKLRAAFRIAFGALIVPLAIVLALYLGYGRFARLQAMDDIIDEFTYSEQQKLSFLPTMPFFGFDKNVWDHYKSDIRLLNGRMEPAEDIFLYWDAHRNEPESHIYYAYYALFLPRLPINAAAPDAAQRYVDAMRRGERIEPENALYNILLAEYYLWRGMIAAAERSKIDVIQGDEMLDRQYFDLGLAELRKGAAKPYLRTHQSRVLRKKLDSLPPPILTEEYLRNLTLVASELFPHSIRFRSLALKIPGCARLLAAEGRTSEAEAVMDSWRPYAELLAHDSGRELFQAISTRSIAVSMATEGAEIYEILGKPDKMWAARDVQVRLQAVQKEIAKGQARQVSIEQRGSRMAAIVLPVFGGGGPAERDLMPSRMHEHVLFEERFVQIMQVLFALLLLGALIQGAIWHFRLREAASVPLLLQPPAQEVLRVLWWGLALPLLIFWLYSRLPVVGGREYCFYYQKWRFMLEFMAMGIILLWLPEHLIRRYVRRRCEDLDIVPPDRKKEFITSLKVKGASLAVLLCIAGIAAISRDNSLSVSLIISFAVPLLALAIVLAIIHFSSRIHRERKMPYGLAAVIAAFLVCYLLITPYFLPLISVALTLSLLWILLRYTENIRHLHALYYGTLARSIAPFYAFSILFFAFVIQPWQLTSELYWLHKDKVIYSYLANRRNAPTAFSSIEERITREFTQKVLEGLRSGDDR